MLSQIHTIPCTAQAWSARDNTNTYPWNHFLHLRHTNYISDSEHDLILCDEWLLLSISQLCTWTFLAHELLQNNQTVDHTWSFWGCLIFFIAHTLVWPLSFPNDCNKQGETVPVTKFCFLPVSFLTVNVPVSYYTKFSP